MAAVLHVLLLNLTEVHRDVKVKKPSEGSTVSQKEMGSDRVMEW